MKKGGILILLLVGIFGAAVAMAVGFIADQPPEIIKVLPISSLVRPAERTDLIVLFQDPDWSRDKFTFKWEVVGYPGLVEQDPEKPEVAHFMSPVEGDFVIQVSITDGWGKTDTEATTIFVR